MNEAQRMDHTLTNVPYDIIFRNARRICKQRYQSSPNWVLVSEVFGLGSTYSMELCRRMGFDPHAKTAERGTI